MISVVVNFYNNQREAPKTLHTLSAAYQDYEDYEVIVIDNGSSEPLDEDMVRSFGPQFEYRYIDNASVSPVAVINDAVRDAKGEIALVMIDGAHMISPGVFRNTERAFRLFAKPFVAVTPFHIGPYMQNDAHLNFYDQKAEDELLATIDWKGNGYRLFNVSAECADMSRGWFGCLFESGCFGIRRNDYLLMGGMDERFQSPGGGMVSLEFFHRAVRDMTRDYVMLIGEGSFHQFHGGVATGSAWTDHPWKVFHAEYESITGKPYFRVARIPYYMGSMRVQSLATFQKTAIHGIRLWQEEFAARPQEEP